MAKTQTQVLLVEDNPGDVVLLREALDAGSLISFNVTVVERLDEALILLQKGRFDIILLDLGLPDSQGLGTLRRLQRERPGIPVVILTGMVDEDLAVLALQVGAQDYLVKDPAGYSTLARSIRYALERQQAQKALRASDERYRNLIENMTDIVMEVDAGGNYCYISPNYTGLSGYSFEDELQGSAFKHVHPDDLPALLQKMQSAFGLERQTISYRVQHKSGAWRWLETSAKSYLAEDGTPRLISVARDITEQKQAESEALHRQKQLEKVLQLGKNITAITDLDACLREIHRSITLGLGFERVGLFSYDAGSNLVRGVYGTSRTGEIEDNSWYVKPVGEWTDWQIALQSPAGMAMDVDYQASHQPEPDNEMYGVRQHITLAAWAGDKPVAMLTVDNLSSQRAITAADLEALQLFAGYAGLAIENAHLHAGLEQRVRERTAEVQDLYDNAPTGYHSLDANGVFTMINQTELDWLGYSRTEVVGVKTFRDLVTPQSQLVFAENFPQFKTRGWVKELEFEMIRKDGSIFPVLLSAVAIYDAAGVYLSSRSTMFDITGRRKAEKALNESEERYRKTISAADAVPYSLDYATSAYTFIGEGIEKITGYSHHEMTPQLFDSFIQETSMHGDLENYSTRESTRLVRTGKLPAGAVWRSDLRILNKAGQSRWLSDISVQVVDEHEQVIGSVGILQDITERKLAENALRASEARLNFLIANTPAMIFTTGLTAGTPITFISDSVRNILGYDPRQYLEDGGFWMSLVHPDDLQQGAIAMQTLLSQGHAIWESRVRRANGEYLWMSSGVNLLRDEAGQPVEVIGYSVDINDEKKAQEALNISEARLRDSRDQLSAANAALEKAARMKDEFLASMSHELRTPLTGILGLSEAMQMKTYGSLSEKQLNALQNIELSGRHLLALINDILDLSKIEAGKLEMQFETFSLADVCQSSLQLTKGMAHQKNQTVSFSMSPGAVLVRADPRRLKQMLVNLLSNAIKFTPAGGSLGPEVAGSEAEQVLRMTVWDRGIGIKPEDLPRLFQPFTQLDSRLARQSDGTGLGLALVQRMTELHGGSMQLESTPGAGSRFTIILPWSAHTTQPLPRLLPHASHLQQSLTVEDNQLDAEQITRYLQSLGLKNVVTPLGSGAVDLAVASKPDVILLDLHLPDKSVLEVLDELKTDERTKSIPVIITSVDERRAEALALGAAGYLVKPFNLEELRTELDRVAAQAKSPVMVTAPSQNAPLVLIVDDNEVALQMIADILEIKKIRVVTARSGVEAIKLASESYPDLILMDIQMPGMDGLEAIRRMRAHADARLATIPIIALTALAMTGDRERCLEAGANDYLSKPVQLQKLIGRIFELLAKRP